MASMGVGSYLSRFVESNLQQVFILVQLLVGLIGGFSTLILFYAFSHLDNYSIFLFILSSTIGVLIGLEIPLIIRILKEYRVLKLNVSNVLTADYVGALVAALLFPLVLVPQLGLYRTALLFGMFNVLVAGMSIYIFRNELARFTQTMLLTMVAVLFLGFALVHTERITGLFESKLFSGEIIYSNTTPYQHIVITRNKNAVAMFINGNLQFNSLDEYRYHESLVHPALSMLQNRKNVLVLGGGDGLVTKELLKYEDVESITVVDIDPTITTLFKSNPLLRKINADALNDKRVSIKNMDAWKFLEANSSFYNAVIVDLPDPNDIDISKLYTRSFYNLIVERMSADGVLVTQATSPFYAREAFWCITHTLEDISSIIDLKEKLHVHPYHVYVPSFGEWGFVIASPLHYRWEDIELKVPTRYLDKQILKTMTVFPSDMSELETEINTIQTHKLAYYYEKSWEYWYE